MEKLYPSNKVRFSSSFMIKTDKEEQILFLQMFIDGGNVY